MPQENRERSELLSGSQDLDTEYRSTWKGEGNSPVIATVSAVAEADGVNVLDVPILADHINPDALNSLFDNVNGGVVNTVTFQYNGYEVTIYRDGRLGLESIPEN